MNKKVIATLTTITLAVSAMPISATAVQASSKVPSKMRGAWYQNLASIKDPTFVKLTARSIDTGTRTSHQKWSGSNFSISKTKSGWYKMGYKNIITHYYKVKKIKINGKYHTALLNKYTPSSHYAEVYVRKNVTLPLGDSQYFFH